MSDARNFIDRVLAGERPEMIAEELLGERTITVVRGGKKVKKTVRTVKKRMSPKQKAALAKARRKSHTGAAKKARAKSLKARKTSGLESFSEQEKEAVYYCEACDQTYILPNNGETVECPDCGGEAVYVGDVNGDEIEIPDDEESGEGEEGD